MLSDLELMERHINVLFKNDESNRMTVVNEPPYDVAPRIFIGSTRLGNVIRFSDTLDERLVKKLERVIDHDTGVDIGAIIGVLSSDRQINHFWTGPSFYFPDVRDRTSKAIRITEINKKCLKQNFPRTYEEFERRQPCFAIIENEKAVSVCCSARQTCEAAEASVATIENARGKNYALDVSNAWATELQNQGRTALYSTSLDNYASRSVARKLHLVQYGTDLHMS
jgi:hypothetical protein